jgi:hypothetical protein
MSSIAAVLAFHFDMTEIRSGGSYWSQVYRMSTDVAIVTEIYLGHFLNLRTFLSHTRQSQL